jgi:hypothetical protein
MYRCILGGIPFPLVGDGVASNPDISPNDFKILVTNADVIIDQTEFKDDKGTYRSVYSRWLELAGFTGGVNPRVLDLRKVFTLDNTVNLDGINGNEAHTHIKDKHLHALAIMFSASSINSLILLCII